MTDVRGTETLSRMAVWLARSLRSDTFSSVGSVLVRLGQGINTEPSSLFIHSDLILQTSRYFTSRSMALHVFRASVQFLMLLLFFHGANSFEKPGTCPETSGGICILECESDDVCPGEEKCCYNGCGHTCQRPEKPECPELKCDLDCTQSGYKLDNGCALCECFVDQCPMIDCIPCPKYYNYTVIDGHICRGCNCVDSVQCPPLGCVCPEG